MLHLNLPASFGRVFIHRLSPTATGFCLQGKRVTANDHVIDDFMLEFGAVTPMTAVTAVSPVEDSATIPQFQAAVLRWQPPLGYGFDHREILRMAMGDMNNVTKTQYGVAVVNHDRRRAKIVVPDPGNRWFLACVSGDGQTVAAAVSCWEPGDPNPVAMFENPMV